MRYVDACTCFVERLTANRLALARVCRSGLAASDEGAKAKLDAKIQKWKLPVIKDACDVLGVSRSEAPDKATLTARLLDFLAEPSAAAASGSKRKRAASGGNGLSDALRPSFCT